MQKKTNLLASLIALLGIYLRLSHLSRIPADAPFRLGGLFYEFSRQIMANGYALPKTIPFYSAGGIPFAYPPLGFYVQAIIIEAFSPPRFWTVNWLPPLIAALTVPSFYFLLRKLTNDQNLVLGALLAYALMPATFTNQIEAAGLAEAFGTLSLIWYVYFLLRVKENGKSGNIIGAGILLAASIASSPGSALGAVVVSLLFFGQMLLKGSKFSVRFVLVGVSGFIISAPYWLTVICNYGIAIFAMPISGQFESIETGSWLAHFVYSFFSFNYAGGEFAILWNVLILLGLFWHILQGDRFPVLLFFALALIPRESVWLTALVTPFLAGAGLVYVTLPLLQTGFKELSKKIRLRVFTGVALVVIVSIFLNTQLAIESLISDEEWKIGAAEIAELETLKNSLPPDAQVLVVGNQALEEWAPQILRREVINTIFGLEWQPNEYAQVLAIQDALEADENWDEVLALSGSDTLYLLLDREKALHLSATRTSLHDVAETSRFRLAKLSTKGN